MKHSSRFFAGSLILCTVLFLFGCAPSKVSFLAKDNLAQDQGLIMARVRIKDHTGALVGTHRRLGLYNLCVPRLVLQKAGERETNDETSIYLPDYENTMSKQKDGTYYFDQYYFITAKPGRYFINYLHLDLGREARGTTTITNYLNVPLYAVVDVKSNGVASVGMIDFELNSTQPIKDYSGRSSYNYNVRVDDSAEQSVNIMSHFRTNYPHSSQKFSTQQPIEKSFFGVYVNFKKYVSASTQHFSRWNKQNNKVCTITDKSKRVLRLESREPKKTTFRYATMKDSLNLPNDYALNYQMRWREGAKDAPYGFIIAQDDKNQLLFGATAAGVPTVWVQKEGRWLANPKTHKVSHFLGSPKQADDYKLAYKNGEFTFRVNNEVAATIKDVLGNKKTKVGFFIAGSQKVEADFISIVEK